MWTYDTQYNAIKEWVEENREELEIAQKLNGPFTIERTANNAHYQDYFTEITRSSDGEVREEIIRTIKEQAKSNQPSVIKRVRKFEQNWQKKLIIWSESPAKKAKKKEERKKRERIICEYSRESRSTRRSVVAISPRSKTSTTTTSDEDLILEGFGKEDFGHCIPVIEPGDGCPNERLPELLNSMLEEEVTASSSATVLNFVDYLSDVSEEFSQRPLEECGIDEVDEGEEENPLNNPMKARIHELYPFIPLEVLKRTPGNRQTEEMKKSIQKFKDMINSFDKRVKPFLGCITIREDSTGTPTAYPDPECAPPTEYLRDDEEIIGHALSHNKAVSSNQCYICLLSCTTSNMFRHLTEQHGPMYNEDKKGVADWKESGGKTWR